MRTVKTVITEDQMSTCSCCKKSRRPPSDYNGSIAPSFKSYNRSHLPQSSALSDVSSQHESTANFGDLHPRRFKKGPSSITSVSTVSAQY